MRTPQLLSVCLQEKMKVKTKVKKPRLISSKRGVVVKGQWKPVNVDPGLFSEDGLDGLVCFEELTEYSLVEPEKTITVQQPANTASTAKKKRKAKEPEDGEEKPDRKKKKKQKKLKADEEPVLEETVEAERDSEDESPDLTPDTQHTPSKKKKKPRKKKKQALAEAGKPPPSQKQRRNWSRPAEATSADVSAWKDLFVPAPVLTALSALGFTAPTPIQALTLPSAIRDRLDILGAAETGERPLTHTSTQLSVY